MLSVTKKPFGCAWLAFVLIATTAAQDRITAEQILRALLIKQLHHYSYDELAFHLADSATYRAFCRLGLDSPPPKKSALQKNIKLDYYNAGHMMYLQDQDRVSLHNQIASFIDRATQP